MNGNRNHTFYGVLFVFVCLIAAGVLYAVIRAPNPQAASPEPNTELRSNVEDIHGTNVEADNAVVTEPTAADAMPADHSSDAPGQPQLGMCRMDDCSWSKETGREIVKSDQKSTLVKLSVIGGSSSGERSPVRWDADAHDVYVFCSTELPSILLPDGGSWQVDVLDFVDGVPGVLESSEALYIKTCHAADRQFPNNAEALGYRSIPDEREEVSISRAEDIFDRAGG